MRKRNFIGAVALAAILAGACTRKSDVQNDPKKVVTEYISRSFSVKSPSEKQEMLDFLTRDAKSRLSAWSDEQFREAFIESKRQFLRLAFTEMKNVSDAEISLTYELSYIDQGKGHDAKITQKKLAQMVKDNDGHWLISDVKNIKELVEYQNEMSLP